MPEILYVKFFFCCCLIWIMIDSCFITRKLREYPQLKHRTIQQERITIILFIVVIAVSCL